MEDIKEKQNIPKVEEGYIYKTTCLVNGKWYIGSRSFESVRKATRGKVDLNLNSKPEDCLLDNKYLGSGQVLRRAIKVYGLHNFTKEILKISSDCRNEESQILRDLGAKLDLNSYNLMDGAPSGSSLDGKVGRKVILVNTGEEFISVSQAARAYGVAVTGIGSCCRKEIVYCGFAKDGETPLVWRFAEDYEPSADKVIGLEIVKTRRAVIRLNDGEIFPSITAAAKACNLSMMPIMNMCLYENYSSNVMTMPNGELMSWQYYDEWLKKPKDFIRKSVKNLSKAVVLLNTGEEFVNAAEAAKAYGLLNNQVITDVIYNPYRITIGVRPDTDNLIWIRPKYLEVINKEEVLNGRPVVAIVKYGEYASQVIYFDSVRDALMRKKEFGIRWQLSRLMIEEICRGWRNCNNEVDWMYTDDYIEHGELFQRSEHYIHPVKSPVICLDTKVVYPNISTAAKQTNTNPSIIMRCCSGDLEKANVKNSNLSLRWQFHKEYLDGKNQ